LGAASGSSLDSAARRSCKQQTRQQVNARVHVSSTTNMLRGHAAAEATYTVPLGAPASSEHASRHVDVKMRAAGMQLQLQLPLVQAGQHIHEDNSRRSHVPTPWQSPACSTCSPGYTCRRRHTRQASTYNINTLSQFPHLDIVWVQLKQLRCSNMP
jgi:hypothetical protein